ncbi:T9SS type A sorting domain-containing protein [Flavobacterium sedimenticola]|uniref:T9SS type A sorting domain-containing protein n=1 Tax=Flavobacterium sedimenticola TaxID=3043286 RepID=A0ABT6XLP7_9FLAO|nr:T9SS type A sorting domain-containing protein [Flavobacterium sedimenticola]MDI9256006.1 T9SS type A sorting domain-containing protein [Flavobacterium sedimenticola]
MYNKVLLIVLFFSVSSYGQSWQWGKRGGALEPLPLTYQHTQEQTYSLVTDNQKRIYGLSRVGFTGLDIDGVPKANFDSGSTPDDYALFSFGCDGSYRWSKIIGGLNDETVNLLQVDASNNIYMSGKFSDCHSDVNFPSRIDSDFINTHMDCRLLFLTKYDEDGNLQWIKRPQPVGVDVNASYGQTASRGLQVDSSGNIYWLVALAPGTYADGGFVNSQTGSNWFILKYNANGDFLGVVPLNMQLSGSFGAKFIFKRNPNNGYFYLSTERLDDTDTAVVAGNSISGSTFLACFDSLGNYLWHRTDTFPASGYLFLYDIVFDSENNIYIGGKMAGFSFGSFLGLTIPETIIPGFVMKVNPTATQLLWSSYSNKGSENYGGIVLNGNELAYTSYCAGTDFTWGTQTLNASNIFNNEGTEVLLARFNRDTGACLGLTKIPGNDGFNDVGTAITADVSGDYILGGAIGGTLTFNNNQQITNSGSQSDFFMAKYATEACSPLAVNEFEKEKVTLYPNPVSDVVYVCIEESMMYSIYNMLGVKVMDGIVTDRNQGIDVRSLANGCYLIQLGDRSATCQRLKFLKQ